MIIRKLSDKTCEPQGEEDIAFDLECIWFIAKKYGPILGIISISAGLLTYLLSTIFSERMFPIQTQVEFILQPQAVWGLPATGDAKTDALLPAFDPTKELPTVFAEELPEEEWTDALKEIQLAPTGKGPVKSSERIRVRGADGKTLIELRAEIRTSRNKPPVLEVGGGIPPKDLERLSARWAQMLNQQVGNLYLKEVKKRSEKLVKAISEAKKNHLENLERARAHSFNDPRTKNSYIFELQTKWTQQRPLFDRLLEAMSQSSLSNPIFLAGEPAIPASSASNRPLLFSVGAFLGTGCAAISYLLFLGAPSRRIFGEAILASIHPQASIYSVPCDTNVLGQLLAASMARLGAEKGKKMAAFIPQEQSSLIEKVRQAAEKSGHSFTSNGSMDAELILFSSKGPSEELPRLPAKGCGRILLVAKRGEAHKARHRLYQSEADLAGLVISDVILF